MKYRSRVKCIYYLIIFTVSSVFLHSQFQVKHSIIGNGAGISNSDSLLLTALIGQPIIGENSELLSGFWYIIDPNSETCSLTGDANEDQQVNIVDIVSVVGFILQFEPNAINEICADCNNDGIIDVIDIVCLVGMILDAD